MEYWPQSQVLMTSAMVTFIALTLMGFVVFPTIVRHGHVFNNHCHRVNGHRSPHMSMLAQHQGIP